MSNYRDSVPVIAAADLSTFKNRAVTIGGTLAASNTDAVGILQNTPTTGQDATAAFQGRIKYVAGAAITAGMRLMVQSGGWMIQANTVSFGIGTALGAVSSGGKGEGIFSFAGVKTQITSSHTE